MEGLPFVELAEEAAAILGMGIPPQDMQGSGQTPIVLEGAGQRVLLGMGLQLLYQERGRHPTALHGACHPQHGVPPIENPWAIDPAGHGRLQAGIALHVDRPRGEKPPIVEVAQPRGEAEPQEIKEREDDLRGTCGIRGMLPDG
jgi:hypothetical protein